MTVCKNEKPEGGICGAEVTWREIAPNKKRPFNVGTDTIHDCPYYQRKSQYELNKAKYSQPVQQQKQVLDLEAHIEKKIEAILDRVNNSDVNILGMLGIQQNILNKIMGVENADEILRLEGEITELKEALKTLQNEKGFKNAGELQ